MSHAAQCLLCSHARTRGNMVIGCLAFENEALPYRATIALTALTFRAAAKAPCPVMDKLQHGPDAYRASDLPLNKDE